MNRLTLLALAAVCGSLASAESFKTKPDIHGDLVAFTSEGDLWLGNLKSGDARRITTHDGLESHARFSPDGKTIAFTAQYDGGRDVYIMPVSGGLPKRLTWDAKSAEVQGWTPDGNRIIFRSSRISPVGGYRRLFSVSVNGGIATPLAVPTGEFGTMGSDGKLVYVPQSNEWANWFRYQAGAADDLWLADLSKGTFRKLTTFKGVDTTPVWCGTSVYYVSEQNGALNLWRLDPATGRSQAITNSKEGLIRYPGSDGKRVIFENGPGLAVYDPASNKTTPLALEMNSDRIHMRERRVPVANEVLTTAIGPSGKRVALEARGQIATVAAEKGEFRVLVNQPGAKASLPAWSADGKKIAFVSDQSGENELWIVPADGAGQATKLTNGLKGNFFKPLWSPDGKWIAIGDRDMRILLVESTTGAVTQVDEIPYSGSYDMPNNSYSFSPDGKFLTYQRNERDGMTCVYVYDIAGAKKHRVSPARYNATSPVFDPSGKFLYYLAERELTPVWIPISWKFAFDNTVRVNMVPLTANTPSPFLLKSDEEGTEPEKPAEATKDTKIDFDGIAERTIEVPIPAGRYSQVVSVPGKLLLLNATSMQPMGGGSPAELLSFDIEKRAVTRIASAGGMEKSADNKKVLVNVAGGFAIIDAASGPATPAPISLTGHSLAINPVAEWKQVYNEAWRIARDFFYDPGMHGVDWNAVKRKYEPQLALVGDRSDLTRILKDMVSELNSGHAYIVDPTPAFPRTPVGYLGADFTPVPGASALKITKLYRGDDFTLSVRSPLLEPGLNVKEGDYLLEVAGQAIKPEQDVQALLVGLAGQTITVRVNDKPSMEGSRLIRVRPLASEDTLRYQSWVVSREEYVRKNGGENFGYAHIPNMVATGLVGFAKGHYGNVDKDAMVYDARFNSGGNVSALLLENIMARPIDWWKPRQGSYWTRWSWANEAHKTLLCNEDNFSDGELIVEMWQRLKLGPVIGTRTGGGEVGSGGGYRLLDGGAIYVPNYAAFMEGKWVVEGTGSQPDIVVEQDPAAVMAGRDPQLDKAIEVLKERLRKEPIKRPKHPAFPDKSGQ